MRWTSAFACTLALMGLPSGSQAADSTVYRDSETGFTFSQYAAAYQIGKTLAYRVAVPNPVPANATYDAVIQIVAPVAVGWGGLAWGGGMTKNPLSVGWANGQSSLIGSRYASSHTTPSIYTGATYQILKIGTKTNSTHWQVTAKCTGCTTFIDSSNREVTLNPKANNRLAFAASSTKPASPSSSTTSISYHDLATLSWLHDFSAAGNTNFAALVAKNA